MYTKEFWLGTLERAFRTFFQALLAVAGADGAGLISANWQHSIYTAALAALMALITALATPTTVTIAALPAQPQPRHRKENEENQLF